jgi:light-regulated signal transduction histidine kinase (bacteriophytochrome)
VRAALIDVSERARLFDELRDTARTLERSNAELQEFASIASHDLREPLRTLAGFAQLLEQRHADDLDDEGREYLGYITHSATRMQHLINDLLTYASVGQQPLRPGPVDTQELVAGTVRSLGSAIEDVQATVQVGSLPTVRGNASQLAQVFLNLVSNALKFRAESPLRVEISAERRGNQWWFSITDNGIGIEPQYGDRVFKMFQRLHTQEEYEGTGMGLTICQRVIERHGGTIWYEQPEPGGSAFRFTLPA